MTYPNNVCHADQYGMIGDYLTPGSGSYYGGFNTDFTDNAPAWNAIMANASPGDTIMLPRGYCGFKSKPDKIPDYVRVMGAGSFTGLVRAYAETLWERIFIDTGVQWTALENVLIFIAPGFVGNDGYRGVGVGHVGTSPADTAYKTTLRNVVVTHFNPADKFYGGCKLSGELGAPNYGTRGHTLDDCQFRATYYGLRADACNALRATNIICPTDTANPPYGIWLRGVQNNPCTQNYIDGVGETSILCYSTKVSVFSMTSLLAGPILDSGCSGVTISAAYMNGAAPQLSGTNNHVFANGQRWDC